MFLKSNLLQYQKEQNEILEDIVFNSIYPQMKEKPDGNRLGLEFFITSSCNKKCTYCYLHKNEDKLYPKEIRDPEIIISNLKILLDHFSKYNEGKYDSLDLFSGEIWGTPFGNSIFDVLLDYADKTHFQYIIIPSNCSFIAYDEKIQAIEKYIEKFKQKQTRLVFSCSTDGLIIDKTTRPYNAGDPMDLPQFYERLWDFCQKYNYCFHPMVDAYTIKDWQENLQWWIKECEKRNTNILDKVMMLEVRNPYSWNDETITDYLKFLKSLVEYTIKLCACEKDPVQFLRHTFEILPYKQSPIKRSTYFPWGTRTSYRASCSVTQSFCIRLGDLSICPCHRLAYPKLIYGKYLIKNNSIIGIETNNISGVITHYITGCGSYLKCDSCAFSELCIKGCHGAQFEYSKEYLYPIPSVCELEQAKILFIILNILKLVEISGDIKDPRVLREINRVKDIYQSIQKKEPEVCKKWIPIVQTLLLKI